MPPSFELRDARPQDAGEIVRLVKALAIYEKLEDQAQATEQDFHQALFGTPPRAWSMLAWVEDKCVGFALWFYNFSTFRGHHGLYLEDIYVDPDYRGQGIGGAFFQSLAARAVAEGCPRMEWSVLNWNEPAINFYRSLGATGLADWTIQRLDGEALTRLAGEH
jgi:diamine N-acetyltransferase